MKIFDFSKESLVVVISICLMLLIAGFFISFQQDTYANMTIFLRLLWAIQILWISSVWFVMFSSVALPVYLGLKQIFKKFGSEFNDWGFLSGLLLVSGMFFFSIYLLPYVEYIEFMDYICDLNQQCVRVD